MDDLKSSDIKVVRPWRNALRRVAPVALVYFFATLLTDAYFMADTADYVDSIAAHAGGVYYDYWEFGHLFWRPVGWLCFKVGSLFVIPTGAAEMRAQIVWTLLALNWLAGLACVLLLRSLVSLVSKREWVANVVTIAFIFSHGFLNFSQTGSPYVLALALLLLSWWILMHGGESGDSSWRTAVPAGAALALAVCLWFLYLWAVPAALLLPLVLFGTDKARRRLAWRTALAFALVSGLSYAAVLLHLGIYSVSGVKAWVTVAAHGNDTRGMVRALFSLSRSLLNMGNDGMLFKRFLLHDPFNPVSKLDLLRLSLWKVGVAYSFLLTLLLGLWRSTQGKRILLLFALHAAPILAFESFLDGGSVERYLSMYPVIFLSLGYVLSATSVLRWQKAVALGFIIISVLVNASAMAKITLSLQQESSVERIKDLRPLLKPGSLVYCATWSDDLVNFNRSFPLHPVNQQEGLLIGALVTPGTESSKLWRQDFAQQASKAWSRGADVWVSPRAFAMQPRSEWNWAEGADLYVTWTDFPSFFAHLEKGAAVGGEDGFVLLPPTIENKRFLAGYAP